MWTRKELKDKAKVSFRRNYWKTVLVALLFAIICTGVGVFGSAPSSASNYVATTSSAQLAQVDEYGSNGYSGRDYEEPSDDFDISGDGMPVDVGDPDDPYDHGPLIGPEETFDTGDQPDRVESAAMGLGLIVVGLSIAFVLLIVIALILALDAFIFNPIEVGIQRFFVRNLNQKAEVREVPYAFDNNYLETAKTLFLRDIFIIAWSLLLIVPGIVKSYEYRMIPYLMAEDPTMTKDRAFAESKRMMTGQKWNAFVLDLSFLGWNILSLLTLGILGVFYVEPYQCQTNAALYEKLRYGLPPAGHASQEVVGAQGAPSGMADQPQPHDESHQAQPTESLRNMPPVAPYAAVGQGHEADGPVAQDPPQG